MSRTIITNSGSEFWTNINSEMMLGELCKEAGCKYYTARNSILIPSNSTLAYSMTKEEADDASEKLIELSKKSKKLFKYYQDFLEPGVDAEEFRKIVLDYAKMIKDSEGYTCLG